MEVLTSALITVALMKKPNRGGKPPIFMNEIAMINNMVECLIIVESKVIDVAFIMLRAEITVETIKM